MDKKTWVSPKLDELSVDETLAGPIQTAVETFLIQPSGAFPTGTPTGPNS